MDRLTALHPDGGQRREPVQERRLVAGDHPLAGEEREGVLAIDRRDEVGQKVVKELGVRDDLGPRRAYSA